MNPKDKAGRMMLTRRRLLKLGAVAGAGLFLPLKWKFPKAFASIPGGTLDPTTVPKYAEPLIIPPAMPQTGTMGGRVDYYEIAVRQFHQQILPTGMPATTVRSYGSVNHPGTFNYPAFTIEASFNRPVLNRTRFPWTLV